MSSRLRFSGGISSGVTMKTFTPSIVEGSIFTCSRSAMAGLHAVSSHGKRTVWRRLHHAVCSRENQRFDPVYRPRDTSKPIDLYLNLGLIHAPGVAHRPRVLVPALFKVRHVPLHPSQDSRMS